MHLGKKFLAAIFSVIIYLEEGTEESAAHSDSLGNSRKSGESLAL